MGMLVILSGPGCIGGPHRVRTVLVTVTTTVTVTVGFGGAVTVLTGAVTVLTGAVIVRVTVGTAFGGAGAVGAGGLDVLVGGAIVVLGRATVVVGGVRVIGGVTFSDGVAVPVSALEVTVDVGPGSVTVAVLAGTAEGDPPISRGMARPRMSAAGTANQALLSRWGSTGRVRICWIGSRGAEGVGGTPPLVGTPSGGGTGVLTAERPTKVWWRRQGGWSRCSSEG
jgi:hypothetical protein